MKKQTKELYRKTHEFYMQIYSAIIDYREKMAHEDDMVEQADLAYVVRECEKLIESIRKELGKTERQSHMLASVLWSKGTDMVNINTSGRIETQYCTAMPIIKKGVVVPKYHSQPEKYLAMMAYFGVPEELAKKDMLRIHWPAFTSHVNELLQEGKRPPNGIDEETLFSDYTLQIRKKRGILDEVEEPENGGNS